eukprot:UN13664
MIRQKQEEKVRKRKKRTTVKISRTNEGLFTKATRRRTQKKVEKDEYGVEIPEKPEDPLVEQTIDIYLPYFDKHGEKLVVGLKRRFETKPTDAETFHFLQDNTHSDYNYYKYKLEKFNR